MVVYRSYGSQAESAMLIAATTDPTVVVVVVVIVTISAAMAAMAALAGAVATIFAEVTVRQAQGTGRHTGRRTRLDRLAAVSRWVE
jgi:hypothetical protein